MLGAWQRRDLITVTLAMGLGVSAVLSDVFVQDGIRPNGFSVIAERESLYGKVRVIDNPMQDLRLLPLMRSGMNRALVIGQGAGHMASDLYTSHGIRVDTIGLDPAVAEAADRHFGFVKRGLQKIGGGRYEVRKLEGPYDLVIHDCFTGGSEPTHLLTREALVDIKRTLSERGVMALNLVAFRFKVSRKNSVLCIRSGEGLPV